MSKINNPNTYRAQLSRKIGKDIITGMTKSPPNVTPMEWAIYNLLCAVEDIAAEMERTAKEVVK